jgi:hypothetical protein
MQKPQEILSYLHIFVYISVVYLNISGEKCRCWIKHNLLIVEKWCSHHNPTGQLMADQMSCFLVVAAELRVRGNMAELVAAVAVLRLYEWTDFRAAPPRITHTQL